MGNLSSSDYSFEGFNEFIDIDEKNIYKNYPFVRSCEVSVLLEFLNVIRKGPSSVAPWEDSTVPPIQELFERASLAVPKSIKTHKIYAYTQNPSFNQKSGGISEFQSKSMSFDNLTPGLQIYYAHVYTIIMMMWATAEGASPLIYLYKSDVLHYACQKEHLDRGEMVVDYNKIRTLIKIVEKCERTGLDEKGLTELSAKGLTGKHFIQRSISTPDVSFAGTSESSSDDVSPIKSRTSNYREAKKKQINSFPNAHIQMHGKLTTIEYLDEILAKVNLICESRGLI